MDLGCGTGLDAVRMARVGHHVTATDWSQRMVDRTRERAEHEQLADRVQAMAVGSHELSRIDGSDSLLMRLQCELVLRLTRDTGLGRRVFGMTSHVDVAE